ncbi:MAG: amidohydrolase [Candidatus Obscuribacterales bacterium]|nr:amidohydrolase [Candidatus Obscuribacterales bacterium]
MTTASADNLLVQAQSLKARLIEIRRHIHRHPELSFEETKTAAYVASILKELGYKTSESFAGTGLIAEIGEGEKTVGIRADMDALPIEEENQNEYCSNNKGVMHACGHDAHITCALGAATLIADAVKKGLLKGRVRFLFQPAEETVNDEGKSGAVMMMDSGATKELSALIALHVFPGIPCGIVGIRSGVFLAACDSFEITILGKGGHGAFPENTVDAVVLASHVVQSLQTVISRRKAAVEPAVLTIGGIRSNTYRSNIVSGEVDLTGTVRYFNKSLSSFFEAEITKSCQIAQTLGGSFKLKYQHDTPALENNPQISETVRLSASRLLGDSNVIDLPVQLGADDFSFYTASVPSCYFVLGVGIEGQPKAIHTADFDINEDALPIGSAILADSALALLNN